MTTHTFTQTIRRQAGYTIDQTILIVAVIAILVTMIIGSVGWDLLTRAGGTKLQSHLVQFENAAGSFFAQYGLWPHDVADEGQNAMLALIRSDTPWTGTFDPGDKFRTYLPAYDPGSVATVVHPFGGSDGEVTLVTESLNNQTAIVFELSEIPADEYRRAEEGIDGDPTGNYWETGRLRTAGGDPSPGADRVVTLRYFANTTN